MTPDEQGIAICALGIGLVLGVALSTIVAILARRGVL